MYAHTVGLVRYRFPDLRALLGKASPARAGDVLAGVTAASAEERVAAQMALADLPLRTLVDVRVRGWNCSRVYAAYALPLIHL